jgi:dipeptidyl aminopeptidase/acylaminoacyl peptidase
MSVGCNGEFEPDNFPLHPTHPVWLTPGHVAMTLNRFQSLAAAAIVALLVLSRPSFAELPPIVPRHLLFRPVTQGPPLVSPNGDAIAWVSLTNGLPQLWIRGVTNAVARPLLPDPHGSLLQPAWQSDGEAILYLQDSDGIGSLHVMQHHVASGNLRDLTPFAGVQARLVSNHPRNLDQIVVSMNLRDRRFADVFRIDVRTGGILQDAQNTSEITDWFADNDLNLSLAQLRLPDGTQSLSTRADARAMWRPILRLTSDDVLGRVVGFGPANTNVWLLTSVLASSQRLLNLHLPSGSAAVIAQDPRFDVHAVLLHPVSNTLQAVQFARTRSQWQLADTNLAADFAALRRFRDADVDIVSRDASDAVWTVRFISDTAPVQYALYHRRTREVTVLYSENSLPADFHGARVLPLSLKARDGLPLDGYLTLPSGLEPQNLPAVVLVHGGPWTRDSWGFDPEAQWLANRGYAVIQINFRGSTGHGKEHLKAGDKEWGGKILLDLVDTKAHVVQKGYVDPKRVAIMGSGFGGYAVLAALAIQPNEFVAGVSLSGTPDLTSLQKALPESATQLRSVLERRMGHPVHDAVLIQQQSPASRAAFVKAPLLAAITGRDPQVPVDLMDKFVTAVRREDRQVEYLYFADEPGSLRTLAARRRFQAATESFLGKHLGGRVELPGANEDYLSLRR